MNILLILISIGALFTLISVGYLLYWNNNPISFIKAGTIIFSGLAVTILSLFLSLKEETKSQKFLVYAIIDERTNLLLGSRDLIDNEVLIKEGSKYFGIDQTTNLHRIIDYIDFDVNWFIRSNKLSPVKYESTKELILESIQWKLLKDLIYLQKGDYYPEISTQNSRETPGIFRKNIRNNYKLSNSDSVYKQLSTKLQNNRIFKQSIDKHLIKILRLPPKSKIYLNKLADESSIEIFKPNFFKITIAIERIDKKEGKIPEGLVYNSQNRNAEDVTTLCYQVNMDAKFYKLTCQNPNTTEYKEWVDWLFGEYKRIYDFQMLY